MSITKVYILFFSLMNFAFQKADVYFTENITPSAIVELYKKLNYEVKGNIGLKVHTGEKGGKYFLTPKFLEEIYDYTKGTFIECNTAYKNMRHTTELHKQLLKDHHWDEYRTVILDEFGEDEGTKNPDLELKVNDPVKISKNYVGGKIKDFDSCIVLSHFKGHGMGGFGAALKQLSIGFGSQRGKTYIHTAGKTTNWTRMFPDRATQEDFTASMGDAASSVVEYFRARKGIAFITVIANISKSCDCAGGNAPPPKVHDIGILASTDPVAIDQAALDLMKAHLENPGTRELQEQIARLMGTNTITVAEKHKIGTTKYNLINVDKSNVFFTREISPDSVVKMFKQLNYPLKGKVGLKVHTGEKGGKYFLTPDFLQKIYDYTGGTFIECNTAYQSSDKNYSRANTDTHKKLLEYHGWTKDGRRMVIMDDNPKNDYNLTVNGSYHIPNNIVGEHLKDFDSALVLAHFKGHGSGGFGGALKQLSIGFASRAGKTNIHTGGFTSNWINMQANKTSQEYFTHSMGDAASTIVNYFRGKKGIAFINVIANISLYCDCSGPNAPEPRIQDIGILASTDPVAIDQASIDLLKTYTDVGTPQLLEQIKFLKGENTIKIAQEHDIGSTDYYLVDIDDHEKPDEEPEKTDEKSKDSYKSERGSLLAVIITLSCVSILLIIGIVVLCFKIHKKDTIDGNVGLVIKEEEEET